MSRRRGRLGWPLVALVLVAGYFLRGPSAPTVSPRPAAAKPPAPSSAPAPVAERPSSSPAAPRAPALRPEAAPRQAGSTTASKRDDKRLSLRVVGVHDGDTLTGLGDSKTQHKIRLDAIDAPELGQPFGQASKKALSGKVFGKDVVIAKTRVGYGRTVGHVLIDGRDVNLELLEEGMAWQYKKYDTNQRLARAEEGAKSAKIGLWSEASAMPPWEWRASRQSKNKNC